MSAKKFYLCKNNYHQTKIETMKKVLIIAVIALFGLAMTSCKCCNKKAAEEPATVEEAVEAVEEKVEDAVRDTQEALEEVSPETKITIDQAQ